MSTESIILLSMSLNFLGKGSPLTLAEVDIIGDSIASISNLSEATSVDSILEILREHGLAE